MPFWRVARFVLLGIVVVALAATALWGPRIASQWQCRATNASVIIPKDGVLFGVNLDWASESVDQYSQGLGHRPAVAAQFTTIPYDDAAWGWVTESAAQVKAAGGVLLLTLEPTNYPWGTNDIPEAGKLFGMLTGTYSGSVGDERAVPDFYEVFGTQHHRPVAITETAALYAPGRAGADELAVKQAWWRQVFSDQVHDQFPMLKMINWFEWNKDEVEVGGVVDWRTLHSPTTRPAFVADLPTWLTYGGDKLQVCTWGF